MSLRLKIGTLFLVASWSTFSLAHTELPPCPDLLNSSSVLPHHLHRVQANGFNTWRDLDLYRQTLGPDFVHYYNTTLRSSREKFHWVDAGAGLAIAPLQFLSILNSDLPARTEYQYPRLTAVSLRHPQLRHERLLRAVDVAWYGQTFKKARSSGHFDYLETDIVQLSRHWSFDGKIDVISDVYGPASYSEFDQILRAYGQLLKPGGKVFLALPRVTYFQSPSEPPLRTYHSPLRERDFWKQVRGLEVTSSDPTQGQITLIRTHDPLVIPRIESSGIIANSPSVNAIKLTVHSSHF